MELDPKKFDKKKYRDQYFLNNKEVAKRQVNYCDITQEDIVLEIGPGLGNITNQILKKNPKKIKVVEKDKKLTNLLKKRFSDKKDKVEIINADALKTDFGDFNKSISNLPYSISSEITFKLLNYDFDKSIWMYQREFAERMVAEPGTKEYGRLTIAIDILSEVNLLEVVPRNFFSPQPRVDSALVEIKPKEKSTELNNKEVFDDLIKAVFTQRRKKLKNALENTIHMIDGLNKRKLIKIKPKINNFLEKRPDKIKPKQYVKIANELNKGIMENE